MGGNHEPFSWPHFVSITSALFYQIKAPESPKKPSAKSEWQKETMKIQISVETVTIEKYPLTSYPLPLPSS